MEFRRVRFRSPEAGGRHEGRGRNDMLNGIRICALVLAAALSWTPMAEAQDQDQVYGVLMKTLSNPFWGAMEEGVRDGASEIGVDYFLTAVESDKAADRSEERRVGKECAR